MDALSIAACRYLKSLLPGQIEDLRPWSRGPLPFFLQNAFTLSELSIHDQRVVLAAAKEPIAPLSLRKMLERLRHIAGSRVLYVSSQMSSYERKRLLDERLEFLVPDSQFYAPSLAIDLRETRSLSASRSEILQLGPSSQAVLIWLLLDKSSRRMAAEISMHLGYSAMTASRAARELEAAGLIEIERSNPRQIFALNGPREEVWERAKPLMRTPVTKTVHVESAQLIGREYIRIAGETALAEQTMLVHPTNAVFAIGRGDWKRVRDEFSMFPEPDHNTSVMQVWAYSPALHDSRGMVDPLSLILSLQHEPDERVQITLDELETNTWQKLED